MIDYETYCRVRLFHQERGLTSSQIGRELGIDPETAAKYAALDTYPRRRATKRASKLDAFKPAIIRWLDTTHPRCYERHRDFEDPDHVKELLDQRRRARDAKWLLTFYALSPHAEFYHQQLKARHLNERIHINKIVALTEIHGAEKVALAIEDAIQSQAYSSQYIENILEQRARHTPTPGPLHLTRRADLLDLELPTADLTPYDTI